MKLSRKIIRNKDCVGIELLEKEVRFFIKTLHDLLRKGENSEEILLMSDGKMFFINLLESKNSVKTTIKKEEAELLSKFRNI